jgi:MerR family transcriptional regulator, light-induced transcriptional regulator
MTNPSRTNAGRHYLGSDTPMEELSRVMQATRSGLVVLAVTVSGSLEPHLADLTALAGLAPLVLAGAGATQQAADAVRARLLTQDPVTAAEQVGWPR